MQGVTLLLIIIGSIFIVSLKPVHGLIVYIVGLTWYPQPLTISIATIDFTVGRVLIIVLLANIFFRTNLIKKFKWNILDTMIMLFFFGKLLALSQTAPMNIFIVREGGGFIDTIFPYFVIRIVIDSKAKLLTFIKLAVIISAPLAVIGVYQSVTGYNPYGFLRRYFSWDLASNETFQVMRRGFYRANVTMGGIGIFGLYFAVLAPLCLGLLKQGLWSVKKVLVGFTFMFFGILSSMTSAPLFSISVTIALLCIFPMRRMWPVILIAFLSWLIFLEFYSNRHFYEVLTRFAFSSSTAYYRIGLVEEAFGGGMTGNWLTGYGYVGIGSGSDNSNFHWVHKDMVNIYIATLARYGLLAIIPFLIINYLYYRKLYVGGKYAKSRKDLWLIWCIMSTLGGLNIALLTVNAMGQVSTLLFMLIGISCNMPSIMLKNNQV